MEPFRHEGEPLTGLGERRSPLLGRPIEAPAREVTA